MRTLGLESTICKKNHDSTILYQFPVDFVRPVNEGIRASWTSSLNKKFIATRCGTVPKAKRDSFERLRRTGKRQRTVVLPRKAVCSKEKAKLLCFLFVEQANMFDCQTQASSA